MHTLRRACLLLATAFVVASTFAAHAQDARTSEVQAAARAWLALTDKLDAQASWNAAGEKFTRQMSAEQWGELLHKHREPFGEATQRAVVSTSFATQLPGAPDGDYALLQFRTAFMQKAEGHESLTLERQPDGQWRVIGYFIR